MIPFIDLKREWKHFETKFKNSFREFGRSGYYVLGPDLENFETNFAAYCVYKYGIGVSSGLSALELSLIAHGVKAGDEVITVANSAVATALAISNIGALPVFCDVKNNSLIDESKIESLITNKTKAIIPVHLFGNICEMEQINAIAQKYNLAIIEDACQAHGADFKDGANINTKAFSFYPTKNLGGMGEGGIIVTNDEKIKNFCVSYRNYGQNGRYNHEIKGNNLRLDPLQCVFLNIKLKELDKFIKKRRIIAKKYHNALKHFKEIEMSGYDEKSSFHLFVIRIKKNKRDELKNYLNEQGIEALVHYPVAIHKQPCFKAEYENANLPNTNKLQDEILSLPCYPFLTNQEQLHVIESILKFFN